MAGEIDLRFVAPPCQGRPVEDPLHTRDYQDDNNAWHCRCGARLTGTGYVCIIHGKWISEHACLYCCLCYKTLVPEECYEDSDGVKWDRCWPCHYEEEEGMMIRAYRAYLV